MIDEEIPELGEDIQEKPMFYALDNELPKCRWNTLQIKNDIFTPRNSALTFLYKGDLYVYGTLSFFSFFFFLFLFFFSFFF